MDTLLSFRKDNEWFYLRVLSLLHSYNMSLDENIRSASGDTTLLLKAIVDHKSREEVKFLVYTAGADLDKALSLSGHSEETVLLVKKLLVTVKLK
jgi:hypothetical protein